MGRNTKTETRERLNADNLLVTASGREFTAKSRVTYRFTEDGVNVVTTHDTYVSVRRNPDGTRERKTVVQVIATGSPDAVASYFAVSRDAMFTEDGCSGSHLFTL